MNKAELIGSMGDDLWVVNSARVSFNNESEYETVAHKYQPMDVSKQLSERDTKLIGYLAKHGHFTPFTHPQITMRETVPIFVARQRFKHMVGFTYNEVSRRYVDDEPEFYEPDKWRGKPTGGAKQGSTDQAITHLNSNKYIPSAYGDLVAQSEKLYTDMINSGVAPEMARMTLPQSMVTSYWVTGSLAAWGRAYKQRIDPHAQKEIRDLAEQWDSIIQPLYPVSWKTLTTNDYVADHDTLEKLLGKLDPEELSQKELGIWQACHNKHYHG